MSDWSQFRDQMAVVRDWVYLDHAAVAPLPGPAVAALQQWSQEAAEGGGTRWGQWRRKIERTRRTAGDMLNTNPENLAFMPNTTSGIGLIAEGFPWRSGDNVVYPAREFPSNQYAWVNLARREVEPRAVSVDYGADLIDALLDACDARTRLIAASWIGFSDGEQLDLARLAESAHARGIQVLIDGIQGVGACPLDIDHLRLDYLVADGHKWMLGPEGAGLLFVAPQHWDALSCLNVGWNSMVQLLDFHKIDWNLRPSASSVRGRDSKHSRNSSVGGQPELLAGARPWASGI